MTVLSLVCDMEGRLERLRSLPPALFRFHLFSASVSRFSCSLFFLFLFHCFHSSPPFYFFLSPCVSLPLSSFSLRATVHIQFSTLSRLKSRVQIIIATLLGATLDCGLNATPSPQKWLHFTRRNLLFPLLTQKHFLLLKHSSSSPYSPIKFIFIRH